MVKQTVQKNGRTKDFWILESSTGGFLKKFSMYLFQHCFICSPSAATVSEDAGIEPRTVATSAMAVRPLTTRLDLIHKQDLIHEQKSWLTLFLYLSAAFVTTLAIDHWYLYTFYSGAIS
jgi:hypothetical protein